MAVDAYLSPEHAWESTLADLEAWARAGRRRRTADILVLAQGLAAGWDKDAWRKWQGDRIRELEG